MSRYTHTISQHNLDAPSQIVPVIFDLLKPKSVVDVGCGLGTFLKVFRDCGATEILGLDGNWVRRDMLFQNINPSEFKELDMEQPLGINSRFDLVVSLEVAEHLSPGRAQSFVADLCQISDHVLFSAAIPRQGGENHLNEQWIDYWQDLFSSHDFEMFDVLRPIFWNNQKIFFWYKQNMVLFVKKGCASEKLKSLQKNLIVNIVHPDLFSTVADYADKNAIKRYARGLFKSVIFKLGLIK